MAARSTGKGRKGRKPDGKENRAATLQAAVEAAKAQLRAASGATSKVKWAQLAKQHGVDRTTLRAHTVGHGGVRRRRVGAGCPTVLPPSEEEAMAKWLVLTAAAKRCPTKRQVLEEAKRRAAKHKRSFSGPNGLPGKDWLKRFRQQHNISERQRPVRSQARASSQEQLQRCQQFFDELRVVLAQPCDTRTPSQPLTYAQCPHRIGNGDESGVQRCTGDSKVLAPTGTRQVCGEGFDDKESLTMFCSGSADGAAFATHFIFSGRGHNNNFAAAGEPGTAVLVKPDTHFIDGEAFALLLHKVAATIPGGVSPTHRYLMLLDFHSSRISDSSRAAAKQLGFDILLLPGGTTHLLQPWDRIFAAIKAAWVRQRDSWLAQQPPGTPLDRCTWVRLLSQAKREAFAANPNLLSNAFKACGIWPFNPEAVLEPLRKELAAAEAAAAELAPAPADVAAAAAAAIRAVAEQQQSGSSGSEQPAAEIDPHVAAEAALQLLEMAGAVRGDASAAAAVLRGERKLAPVRQGKGKKRLSYWFTGPEWEAQHQQEQQQAAEKAAAKAAKAEATAAKRAAAAAARAAKQQATQPTTAGAAAPKRQRKAAALPR